MTATIRFLGAADTVTGSKYLVEPDGHSLHIDCGLFQGFKQLRLRNREPLPVLPNKIGAVLLTHAHLDHSGHLPLLVNEGFCGKVWTTPTRGTTPVARRAGFTVCAGQRHALRPSHRNLLSPISCLHSQPC